MSNLKDQLIRLGNSNPELRKHLKPVLDRISSQSKLKSVAGAIADIENNTPSGSPSRWFWMDERELASKLRSEYDIRVSAEFLEQSRDEIKEMVKKMK
jgi:hypothetical protein